MTTLPTTYRALVVDERDGVTDAAIVERDSASLADEGVVVAVSHSAINYKDGLAITGRGKILRSHPMIAGVEMAGTVVSSRDPRWPEGTAVIAGGWGIGERFSGTYAELFAAKPEWLEALPTHFDSATAMGIGIAGVTAMECIVRLRHAGLQKTGPVLVTGAAGGVGSLAVRLLSACGFEVAASTGRPELEPYLRALGATQIVPRDELAAQTKPLARERWAGAIDTVGGAILAGLLGELRYGASAAVVGLANSAELHTTVFPFILRANNLLGIDSTRLSLEHRATLWSEIGELLTPSDVRAMMEEIPFEQVIDRAHAVVEGKVRGRTVVSIARR